jgi:hypothetical protein
MYVMIFIYHHSSSIYLSFILYLSFIHLMSLSREFAERTNAWMTVVSLRRGQEEFCLDVAHLEPLRGEFAPPIGW